jgi:hypothetical protein
MNQELDQLNGESEQRAQYFAQQNQILNATTQALTIQVDNLEENVIAASRQNGILQNMTKALQNETENVSAINLKLNLTVVDLGVELDSQVLDNNCLTELNQDLTVIVAFWNNIAANIN